MDLPNLTVAVHSLAQTLTHGRSSWTRSRFFADLESRELKEGRDLEWKGWFGKFGDLGFSRVREPEREQAKTEDDELSLSE